MVLKDTEGGKRVFYHVDCIFLYASSSSLESPIVDSPFAVTMLEVQHRPPVVQVTGLAMEVRLYVCNVNIYILQGNQGSDLRVHSNASFCGHFA